MYVSSFVPSKVRQPQAARGSVHAWDGLSMIIHSICLLGSNILYYLHCGSSSAVGDILHNVEIFNVVVQVFVAYEVTKIQHLRAEDPPPTDPVAI